MQGFRGDAILCAGHVPRRGEPNHEWSTCAVEDGSGRHRDAALALFAPESPATHPPTAGRVASRTDETVGPAQPFKIVETGRFVREPRQQIGIAGRIISPCSKIGGRRLRRKRHPYILCLQHSDGHPFSANVDIGSKGGRASSVTESCRASRTCCPRIRPEPSLMVRCWR